MIQCLALLNVSVGNVFVTVRWQNLRRLSSAHNWKLQPHSLRTNRTLWDSHLISITVLRQKIVNIYFIEVIIECGKPIGKMTLYIHQSIMTKVNIYLYMYGSHTCFLTVRAKYRPRVFENRILMWIFLIKGSREGSTMRNFILRTSHLI